MSTIKPIGIDTSSGQLKVMGGSDTLTGPVWSTFSPTITLVGGAGNVVPVFLNNIGRKCLIGKIMHVQIELSGDGMTDGAGTGIFHVDLPAALSASASTLYAPGAELSPPGIMWAKVVPGESTLTLLDPTENTGANVAPSAASYFWNFSYEID